MCERCSEIGNALGKMKTAVSEVIKDNEKQMRVAMVLMVILIGIGLPFVILGVLVGKIEQTGLGAVIEVFTVAPYLRYDSLRKEKNYYQILLPSMEAELAGCRAKSSAAEIANCCSDVLHELVNLRDKLRAIATSGTR